MVLPPVRWPEPERRGGSGVQRRGRRRCRLVLLDDAQGEVVARLAGRGLEGLVDVVGGEGVVARELGGAGGWHGH